MIIYPSTIVVMLVILRVIMQIKTELVIKTAMIIAVGTDNNRTYCDNNYNYDVHNIVCQ